MVTGICGAFGHWLLIKAYKQASTAALAPCPYSRIVWMVGASIIVASGLYVARREHRLRQIAARAAAPDEAVPADPAKKP